MKNNSLDNTGFFVDVKSERDYRSKIELGNITIFVTKKFNWFNRLMLRLVFGLKIEGVGR